MIYLIRWAAILFCVAAWVFVFAAIEGAMAPVLP